MKQIEKKLNYKLLLEDWTIDLIEKIEKCEQKLKKLETGSYEYGYYKGIQEGYKTSLAKMDFLKSPQKNAKYFLI
jgi:hypothetical protein